MNLTCDIVMDLVSIYKDELASESTCEAIEAHLKECPACRKYYKQYDSICGVEPPKSAPVIVDDYKEKYTALAIKLNRRRKLAMLGMAAFACVSIGVVLASALKPNDNCKY